MASVDDAWNHYRKGWRAIAGLILAGAVYVVVSLVIGIFIGFLGGSAYSLDQLEFASFVVGIILALTLYPFLLGWMLNGLKFKVHSKKND